MLPEEQLYKILRNKQAGIFDLYMQQGNLGGNTFKDDENPLQALLGQEFVDKYGEDYEVTCLKAYYKKRNIFKQLSFSKKIRPLQQDAAEVLSQKGDIVIAMMSLDLLYSCKLCFTYFVRLASK